MKMLLILSLLSIAIPGWAQRTPTKCGKAVAARAERVHRNGYRIARVPRQCESMVIPKGYIVKPGPIGNEIWKGEERLVWAVDTLMAPIDDPPPGRCPQFSEPTKAKKKRTVTTSYWRHGQHFVVQEESEL